MRETEARMKIRELFALRKLGVVATRGEEYPYTSLVGFVPTEDLGAIVFATLKNTRKYSNLMEDPRVTLLVNSASGSAGDFENAFSVTVLGEASVARKEQEAVLRELYLSKLPFLEEFINDPDCALVQIKPVKFIVVNGLRAVSAFDA
ncbi:MAG: pyridoxamine 5'-phosphate oxidase family protein [Candidatus Omnitrophica bacterium]|nr:pyridoxamine 5'-phosphate oxidase family protein [Candidatus Omnitrophota bacterium]